MGVLVIGSTLALMLSQGICHFLNKKMVQVWEYILILFEYQGIIKIKVKR